MGKQPSGFFSASFFFTLNVSFCSKIFALYCCTFFSTQLLAQQTIKGRVADSTSKPISGVSVIVKGTKNGTSTNALGEFQLNGVADNAVIVISNIGFETLLSGKSAAFKNLTL